MVCVQVHRLAANHHQQQQRSGRAADDVPVPAHDATMCALLQQLAVLRSIAGQVYAANSSAGAAAAAAEDGIAAGISANACRAAAAAPASSTLKLLDGQLLQLALGELTADLAFAVAGLCDCWHGLWSRHWHV
jgi:hypothetical protein